MEIRKEVDSRAVLAAWLQSEWKSPPTRQEMELRLFVWNVGPDLIERPRLDRPWDHWVRLKVLEGFRDPIWERLPEDIRWVEAVATPADVGEWRVRPGDTVWEILSGRSGRVAGVAACARDGALPPGCPVRDAHRCQASLDLIRRIARGIGRHPLEAPILLLAPAEAGPFTILDGHKRAAGAYWVGTLEGRAGDVGPLSAYLGISPQPSPFRQD